MRQYRKCKGGRVGSVKEIRYYGRRLKGGGRVVGRKEAGLKDGRLKRGKI